MYLENFDRLPTGKLCQIKPIPLSARIKRKHLCEVIWLLAVDVLPVFYTDTISIQSSRAINAIAPSHFRG
jgi:hypothetical protein